MRASRLVSLLLLLQTRGQLTAGELARELEVSERTVHRDVEALSASGVPIYAERGPHGGIRLVDGYRTRLTGMTGEEAEALFLAGLPGPAAELGLGTVVAAAQLKVLASLPPELRARASRLVERFHLDAGEWFHANEPVPYLAALSDAVWNSTRIAIEYDRGSGPARREIEPLGLVLKAGIWYVVAGTDGGQVRTYRISRVVGAEPGDERFERPAGFDLAGYWADAAEAFEREAPRIAIDVRVRPDRLDQLRTAVGHGAMEAAESLPETDPEGWLRLRLRLDWPDEAPVVMLRAGRWVEVLGPPEVRARVASTARAIAERYAGDLG
ncbi:MAG TPA: YafY family protein [Candidatus Limnocylindrales bacterium]|nr:YafY family protein [Candidatus Limnocylindrales bacterium]